MKNNEEKTCQNCKHYLEHYIKRNAQLRAIGGHCINRELNAKHPRKCGQLYENCEYWESDESIKPERREYIKKTLRDMHERLKQIEMILKDDE